MRKCTCGYEVFTRRRSTKETTGRVVVDLTEGETSLDPYGTSSYGTSPYGSLFGTGITDIHLAVPSYRIELIAKEVCANCYRPRHSYDQSTNLDIILVHYHTNRVRLWWVGQFEGSLSVRYTNLVTGEVSSEPLVADTTVASHEVASEITGGIELPGAEPGVIYSYSASPPSSGNHRVQLQLRGDLFEVKSSLFVP